MLKVALELEELELELAQALVLLERVVLVSPLELELESELLELLDKAPLETLAQTSELLALLAKISQLVLMVQSKEEYMQVDLLEPTQLTKLNHMVPQEPIKLQIGEPLELQVDMVLPHREFPLVHLEPTPELELPARVVTKHMVLDQAVQALELAGLARVHQLVHLVLTLALDLLVRELVEHMALDHQAWVLLAKVQVAHGVQAHPEQDQVHQVPQA